MGVGSHGLRHQDWRRLSDDDLREELEGSRTVLGDLLGSPVEEAACPFGSYDRRVLRVARAAGYRRLYTSDGGAASTTWWLAPRNTVDRNRPLTHWRGMAAAGPQARTEPVRLAKRLVKRLR